MESSILWLRIAACLYGVGLLHSMLAITMKNPKLYPVALGTFRVAVVLHGVALVEVSMAYGRLPLDSLFETLSVCAFLVALLFLFVQWRYHFTSTAVALFPLIFMMALAASMQQPSATWPNVGVKDAWLVVHIVSGAGGICGTAADRRRVGVLSDAGTALESQAQQHAAGAAAAARNAG